MICTAVVLPYPSALSDVELFRQTFYKGPKSKLAAYFAPPLPGPLIGPVLFWVFLGLLGLPWAGGSVGEESASSDAGLILLDGP